MFKTVHLLNNTISDQTIQFSPKSPYKHEQFHYNPTKQTKTQKYSPKYSPKYHPPEKKPSCTPLNFQSGLHFRLLALECEIAHSSNDGIGTCHCFRYVQECAGKITGIWANSLAIEIVPFPFRSSFLCLTTVNE